MLCLLLTCFGFFFLHQQLMLWLAREGADRRHSVSCGLKWKWKQRNKNKIKTAVMLCTSLDIDNGFHYTRRDVFMEMCNKQYLCCCWWWLFRVSHEKRGSSFYIFSKNKKKMKIKSLYTDTGLACPFRALTSLKLFVIPLLDKVRAIKMPRPQRMTYFMDDS